MFEYNQIYEHLYMFHYHQLSQLQISLDKRNFAFIKFYNYSSILQSGYGLSKTFLDPAEDRNDGDDSVLIETPVLISISLSRGP